MSDARSRIYDAGVAVTTSDATDDPKGPFAGLLIANSGTLAFLDFYGNTITMAGTIAAGTELHIMCKRVKTTGTTAVVYGLYGADVHGPRLSV